MNVVVLKKPRGRPPNKPMPSQQPVETPGNIGGVGLPTNEVRSMKSPPIGINSSNGGQPLVFAVKSRPVVPPAATGSIPQAAPTNSIVAEKVAAAVRRTYEGKPGSQMFKFDLGEGQVGVAAVGNSVETDMPYLCQTTDVPPGVPSSAAFAMPELEVEQDQPNSIPNPNPRPMKPKSRFYSKDNHTNETKSPTSSSPPEIHQTVHSNPTTPTSSVPSSEVQVIRSVRNKRKKEVFDPSDVFPKKKAAIGGFAGVVVKQEAPEEEEVSYDEDMVIEESPVQKRGVGRPRQSTSNRPPRVRKPRVKKGSNSNPPNVGSCKSCNRFRNIRGNFEKFSVCSVCASTYHPSCAQVPKELLVLARTPGKFQCKDCKKCELCSEIIDKLLNVDCKSCLRGYHLKCLKLDSKPTSWECDNCGSGASSDGSHKKEGEVGVATIPKKRGPKKKPRKYVRKQKTDDRDRKRNRKASNEETIVVQQKSDLTSLKPNTEPKPEKSVSSDIVQKEPATPTSENKNISGHSDLPKLELVLPKVDYVYTPGKSHQIAAPILEKEIPQQIFMNADEVIPKFEPFSAKHETLMVETMQEAIDVGEIDESSKEPADPANKVEDIVHPPVLPAFGLVQTATTSTAAALNPIPAQTPVHIKMSPSGQPGPLNNPINSTLSAQGSAPTIYPSNPSNWSVNEVEQYFREHGLRDEGAVFRDQEIDGISLMLMRRADIVQGMRFKLGPALKVHRLVAELQNRSLNSTD